MPVSTPNYLTTDASGRVVAMFSGGIILPTPSTGLYDSGSSITWTDGPGGARIADIRTVSIGNPGQTANGQMVLETFSEGHSRSEIDLTANGHGGDYGAQLIVGSATDADSTNSTITATAGGATKKILGKGGVSDFLMVSPPNDQEITAHDLYISGGALRGPFGGAGVGVGCRGGNVMSFNWNGNVEIWVDSTLVRSF